MRRTGLVTLLVCAGCSSVTPPIVAPSTFLSVEPRPRVMVLGMFHFADAGLDAYQPKHQVDILSPGRQREVELLVERLARFRPTRVALEVTSDDLPAINQRYREYLAGSFALPPNEIYQIGFRLARAMGHGEVYGIDAMGREYETAEEGRAQITELGQESLVHTPWDDRFKKLYEHDDELKTRLPLVDYLRYINSPERVRAGHGAYLTGLFHAGRGANYLGPDYVSGWWYVRNLRIFENIYRTAASPTDRVLAVIGAGHLPVLLHALQTSPEVEWVDVREVLAP